MEVRAACKALSTASCVLAFLMAVRACSPSSTSFSCAATSSTSSAAFFSTAAANSAIALWRSTLDSSGLLGSSGFGVA